MRFTSFDRNTVTFSIITARNGVREGNVFSCVCLPAYRGSPCDHSLIISQCNIQECIPVGCVLSATVAICWQGGSPPPHPLWEPAPPWEQAPPPRSRHPPWGRHPPGAGTPPTPRDLLQAMLGYHLQGMLGFPLPPLPRG